MLAPISPEADSTCRANISSSGTPLATWAATTDPADVPTSRSAAPRSTPASAKPRSRPTSQATPVTPPPPRTTARRNIRTRVARTVSPGREPQGVRGQTNDDIAATPGRPSGSGSVWGPETSGCPGQPRVDRYMPVDGIGYQQARMLR